MLKYYTCRAPFADTPTAQSAIAITITDPSLTDSNLCLVPATLGPPSGRLEGREGLEGFKRATAKRTTPAKEEKEKSINLTEIHLQFKFESLGGRQRRRKRCGIAGPRCTEKTLEEKCDGFIQEGAEEGNREVTN